MVIVDKSRLKGFSVLELMIVVTIIGILASVAVQKWREYQSKTRDNIRKLALVQVSKALEVYYMKHRSYPSTSSAWWGESSLRGSRPYSGDTAYIPGLAPKYINELPRDPLMDDLTCADCGYWYISDGVGYKFASHLSAAGVKNEAGPESFPKVGEPFYDATRPTHSIMVCSGTGECKH